jgi:CubicO group peptidase (beta-lactamase class C family)
MKNKSFLKLSLTGLLIASTLHAQTSVLMAQTKPADAPAPAATDQAVNLAALEAAVEARRKELGIPGLSLAIVKDDKVIFSKGFGVRDVAHNTPVTPDTLFAIGSCTKAFTAFAAMISVDEKKLSLEDSPKKYLPYFKISEPAIDEKITVRDLLTHRSGLAGTDLVWYTGVLNREEAIRAVGTAKPTAKLGEKFQYQNVMYSAAGEVIALAQQSTWEDVISKRILLPLGMKTTNLSVRDMKKASDYSLGYDSPGESKTVRELPIRDIANIAAAGAINSSANEMAQWARLMLGGGSFEGKRLISEAGFKELWTPQIKWGPQEYGLGWGLVDFKGHKVATHSGGIDGFNSLVALMPDKHLGFVLLTNVSSSLMGLTVMDAVFTGLDKPASAPAAGGDMQREVGKYNLSAAGFDVDVSIKDGKLTAVAPGQPVYTLENIGGRKYKVASPPMEGFFITFQPVKGHEEETEAYLESPQGDFVMPRVKEKESDVPKDAIGVYKSEKGGKLEIKAVDDKIALVATGQPPYPLVVREKDVLGSSALPDTYSALLKRNEKGGISGLVMRQPNGNFDFTRVDESSSPAADISIEDLNKKMIVAAGGEANLRKHKSSVSSFTIDLENQGVTVDGKAYGLAPGSAAREMNFSALGKKIATVREYFDGTSGGSEPSFAVSTPLTGSALTEARVSSDFYELLDWKTLYEGVSITGTEKVDGEDCYVVEFKPAKGMTRTEYVSKSTFLPRKLSTISPTGGQSNVYFSEFRAVDGVVTPFKVVQVTEAQGRAVLQVKEFKFDVDIPQTTFQPRSKTP